MTLLKSRTASSWAVDLIQVDGAQIRQRNVGHFRGRIGAAGFFGAPLPQVGRLVAKGFIAGKFGLTGGGELIALLHIMHILQGEAPAFFEERADDLAVKAGGGQGFDFIFQGEGLKRVMPAQGRIAAADQDKFLAGGAGGFHQVAGNLAMDLGGLRGNQAARIGQHEENPAVLAKGGGEGAGVPSGVDRDVVDGLHAGGVVIQHDNF